MDRPLPRFWLLALCLFAASGHAESELGEAEYKAALTAQEQLQSIFLMGALPGDGMQSRLKPRETLKMRAKAEDLLLKYQQEMEVSADLGFAPAQYALAHLSRLRAATDAWLRVSAKSEACDQLYRTTSHKLLAGSLGFAMYCSRLDPDNPSPTDAEQEAMAMRKLTANLEKPELYAAVYPLQAFDHPLCFEAQWTEQVTRNAELSSLAQLQPLYLTLEQTQAEAYLRLALYEAEKDPAAAQKHMAQAQTKGCTGEAFVSLQAQLNAPTQP